jgi:2-polyprenyl-3-methyl-5-hydroxy-6-metoxy-1,4-benzoquinol methylase
MQANPPASRREGSIVSETFRNGNRFLARPQAYEKYLVPALMGPWAEQLVDAAAIAPGEHVLDVGCGTGIVARTAARRAGTGGRGRRWT